MKRRLFLQSSVAAAVAATIPGSQAMAQALAAMEEAAGNINAVTGSGAEVTLEQAAVEELRASLRGRLLLPGAEGYDSARAVLNPTINKFPALIVQPAGAADIMSRGHFCA